MAALRVIVFSENSEVELRLLPWIDVLHIIHGCNALWKTFETKYTKYRTLPEDDGELYVTPGRFDECRCSDSEVMLEDEYPYNLDDHHFYQTELPPDIEEKNILYYHEEGDGYLGQRKMVGDVHPLYDPQSPDALKGMTVRFELVVFNQEDDQDSVS